MLAEEELSAAQGSGVIKMMMAQMVRRSKQMAKAGRREEIRRKDREEMERIEKEDMQRREMEKLRRKLEEEKMRQKAERKAKEQEEARQREAQKRRAREKFEREERERQEEKRRFKALFNEEEPKSSESNLEQLNTKARNVMEMPSLMGFLKWLYQTFPPVEPQRSRLESLIKLGTISRTDYRKILMIYHPDKNAQQEQAWRSSCEEISKVSPFLGETDGRF
jgi:hypothetical protein